MSFKSDSNGKTIGQSAEFYELKCGKCKKSLGYQDESWMDGGGECLCPECIKLLNFPINTRFFHNDEWVIV